MLEFNRHSTIKELINSKKNLKALGWMLSIRDTTIKEVFNGLGYVYHKKSKEWVNENENYQANWTFQQALEHIRPRTRKLKTKLTEKNSETTEEETNIGLSEGVLNAIGLPHNELTVLKETIIEGMNQGLIQVNVMDISNEVSKLNSSRKRKNRTFYLGEELMGNVTDLANKSNVKVSQLVEVALIEMLDKYKTSIKIKINKN